MLVPSSRLLLLSAVVVLPLATIGGMFAAAMPACGAALAVCVAIAAMDAAAVLRRISGVGLRTPSFVRLTKEVPAHFPVTVEQRRQPFPLRLGINLPQGVETD